MYRAELKLEGGEETGAVCAVSQDHVDSSEYHNLFNRDRTGPCRWGRSPLANAEVPDNGGRVETLFCH